jgi:hypothetical protein
MSDVVDTANALAEMHRELALDELRKKADAVDVEPTGWCLYCGETVSSSRRWCDAAHRDAWEKERKAHGQ